MLWLGRYPGEKIIIDCPDGTKINIEVGTIDQHYGRLHARVGIEAPQSYKISRDGPREQRKRDAEQNGD